MLSLLSAVMITNPHQLYVFAFDWLRRGREPIHAFENVLLGAFGRGRVGVVFIEQGDVVIDVFVFDIRRMPSEMITACWR